MAKWPRYYRVVPYTAESGDYGAATTSVPASKISAALRTMQETQTEQITFAVIYPADAPIHLGDSPIGVAILVQRTSWAVRLAERV